MDDNPSVNRFFQKLNKEYTLMGTTCIKAWQLYLLIGLFVGFFSGIVFVANQKGKFGKTKAQPPAVVEPQATGENVPIYFTYSISEKEDPPFSDQNMHPFVSGAMVNVKWRQVHKAPGTFNWSRLDTIIRDWTGGATPDADIPRKIFLKIVPYGASPIHDEDGGEERADLTECVNDITPEWVYESVPKIKFLGGVCKQRKLETVVPKVWDAAFYPIYEEFIRALGERYNGDKRVAGFQVGIGIIGTINAAGSKEAATAFQASPHNWTLPVWEQHSYKIIDISKRHLLRPLILRTSGGFLDPFPIYKEPGLDTAKRILKYAAEKDIAILFSGLAPEARQVEKSAIPKLVSYLGSLDLSPERFRIGFTDDWPLWEPDIRKKGKKCPDAPRCNRTESGFAQELQHAFHAWEGINKKYPAFFFFLDNELVASNPETTEQCGAETRYGCFYQPVYDVIAQYFTPFLPPIPPITNLKMEPKPPQKSFAITWIPPAGLSVLGVKGYTAEVGYDCQPWNGQGEPQCNWEYWYDFPTIGIRGFNLNRLPNERGDHDLTDGPELQYGKIYCVDVYLYRTGQDISDDVYACGMLTNPAPPFTGTVTPLASSIVAVSWPATVSTRARIEFKTTPFISSNVEGTLFPKQEMTPGDIGQYTRVPSIVRHDLCPTEFTPDTTYYGRVWTKDAQGKEIVTQSFTFRTPPRPVDVFSIYKDWIGIHASSQWDAKPEIERNVLGAPFVRSVPIDVQWSLVQPNPPDQPPDWSALDAKFDKIRPSGKFGKLKIELSKIGKEGTPEWAADGAEQIPARGRDDDLEKVVKWDPEFICRSWQLITQLGRRYDNNGKDKISRVPIEGIGLSGEMATPGKTIKAYKVLGYSEDAIAKNMQWVWRETLQVYHEAFPHRFIGVTPGVIYVDDAKTRNIAEKIIADAVGVYGKKLVLTHSGIGDEGGAFITQTLRKYSNQIFVGGLYGAHPSPSTVLSEVGKLFADFVFDADDKYAMITLDPSVMGLHPGQYQAQQQDLQSKMRGFDIRFGERR